METTRMEQHDPDDPVAIYIREVGKIETLSKDEETKLFQELGGKGNWDETRENVARRLIESRLALVVSVAQKHSTSGSRRLWANRNSAVV